MKCFIGPFVIFVLLLILLAAGLALDQRESPTPLIGKPAPAFSLETLEGPEKTFHPQDLLGQVWLLNVWASWCVSCRHEHQKLLQLAKTVPVVGLNYKEIRGDVEVDVSQLSSADESQLVRARVTKYLEGHGNPYVVNVFDLDGRVGLDYGVVGVPETLIIDGQGIVRFKQIGPLSVEVMTQKVLPLLAELQRRQP